VGFVCSMLVGGLVVCEAYGEREGVGVVGGGWI